MLGKERLHNTNIFSSLEPKVIMIFSDRNLSVVRRRRPCCKLFTFSYSWTTGQISTKLDTNEEPCPYLREDNNEKGKVHLRNLKIFFTRTTGPISIKPSKIHGDKMCLWNTMPSIVVNSNERQDHKDKYFDTSLKILSQEMTMCNMEALVSYF